MQTYARTYPEFWTSRVGRLDDGCRALAHYLYSGLNVPPYGLYYRPVRDLAREFGRSEPVVRGLLRKLHDIDYVSTDEATGFVWVREAVAYQFRPLPMKGNNPMVRAVRRWYANLPKNPFLGPFYDRYAVDLLLADRSAFPGSEVERRDYGLAPEQDLLLPDMGPAPVAEKKDVPEAFEAWIAAYPAHRRAPTKRAVECWRRRKLTAAHLPPMLATLAAQKRSPDWTKQQGQFVPKACNYLRDELDREKIVTVMPAGWSCPHKPKCTDRAACDDRYYREEIAPGGR